LEDLVLRVIVGLGGASDRTMHGEERYGWYCYGEQLKGKEGKDRVLRVIVGQERERVTEQCMVRSVMVGTVRVSS